MFNIGDEDKEKLKDNMDEIKNLINKEGENPQSQNQTDSQFQQVSQQQGTNLDNGESKQKQKNELEEELESSLQDLDQKEQQTQDSNFNQQNNNQFGQESLNNENLEKNTEQPESDEFANPENNSQGQENKDNFDIQQENNGNIQSQEQPNFSGNSLFLRVERFRNIEGLVSQMRDLTNQIDQQIGDLERTNEEDRQIKEETHKILSEFSSRRQEMEESLMKNN